MEIKQFADSDGKFYPSKFKVGDAIKGEESYGFIQFFIQRDQFADADGTIVWLEESEKKVIEGDVICIINDELQTDVPVALNKEAASTSSPVENKKI